ncbi:unnamed protein product [Rotaria magnacalcarata]|uniref:FLYWCH-type domain-containing protein n=1 Tax=Rotaria magnacalcarata TaxID=392030 RepID=A0A816XZQ8_9BILA|nr:unnamed protein product [Rotaria magnacalcarata]CAF2152762.1 unnamed protein product [Rotaria magnacalcarata]CAF4196174.1 unnamed protein product [Rotaria magnacalcarata]CAF4408435.1 unnamed protein product [Rotaria magnacalcarata]
MISNTASENSSFNTQQLEISFATSNKRSRLKICDNYLFRCCCVYIHTNVNKELISTSGNHNHSANPNQLEATIAKLSKAAAAILITVIEYRSNMREAHRKITPVIPSSVIFDIPEWYQQTFSSERFLLVNLFMTHGKDRVLVCSSDQHLELLFESETIFMDGTFDTTPANFKQV